jgi:DEAD/DEAH box helicase domain-containing protein
MRSTDDPGRFGEALTLEPLASGLVHVRHTDANAPVFAELARPLPPPLHARWSELGLSQLYVHQAAAIDAARKGRDVMLVTGTSSGKTLAYAGPIFESLLTEPSARALIIFPTKALAQDQLSRFDQLSPSPHFRTAVYDGDTPTRQRSAVRREAHIVLTNPDMLHVGILPGHENWVKFFKSLRWIVLDEAHTYRGVFGSHVANVMRRLLRLCEAYGSRPQIIACSATVGNPEEHFGSLFGRIPVVVDRDGSATGARTYTIWNPPQEAGKSFSRNLATAQIMVELAAKELRTLAFCRSRVGAELVVRYARQMLEERKLRPDAVESYRAGYTPKERRQIEKDVFSGKTLGLASTNAMELGVDIGGLDVVIINGYPGSVASFWQQAGRAGRGSREGLVVYLAQEDPLDQFLAQDPDSLLNSKAEQVTLNSQNPNILADQLMCAAHERPIAPSELDHFGESAISAAEALGRSGVLEFRAGRFFYPRFDPPAPKINIRGSGGETVLLKVGEVELGTMEHWRALQNAHAGAVYLHRGASYMVRELDLETNVATLEPHEANFFTQAMVQSVVEPLYELQSKELNGVEIKLNSLRITSEIQGFKRVSLDGESILSIETLDLPPQTFETLGVRWVFPEPELDEDPEMFLAALHGVEHAMLAIAPFYAGCDRNDLGSTWYAAMPDVMRPAVVIFDHTPGGVGLSEKLFEKAEAFHWGARRLLEACDCDAGCPRCLLSSRCSMGNDLLSKTGAVHVLSRLTK